MGVLVIILGFGTAQHWIKVDVPEHPESFHEEQYLTGEYDITDNGDSPCWIGQDWTDCVNALVEEYNDACVGVVLTPRARTTCTNYSDMIDDLMTGNSAGYEVSALGDYGRLTRVPATGVRQVSNNDYRPAVTHEAVCYFGFIGECR